MSSVATPEITADSPNPAPAPPPARDVRQRGLVPPERLAKIQAFVVGVGAIGRQLALQLAAMGVPKLTLIDFDHVELVNLGPQGYWHENIGQLKVLATKALCRKANPDILVEACAGRFRNSSVENWTPDFDPVVFCAVDSITTRGQIWDAVSPKAKFFVDGRMSGEQIRVVAVSEPASDTYYKDTLFTAEEAFAGSCTAQSTIYTASIAAGLMISQFTRWLRGAAPEKDIMLNLPACELMVLDAIAPADEIAPADAIAIEIAMADADAAAK